MQSPPPSIEIENHKKYVDKILDSRRRWGKLEYFVHWSGYDINERTWESAGRDLTLALPEWKATPGGFGGVNRKNLPNAKQTTGFSLGMNTSRNRRVHAGNYVYVFLAMKSRLGVAEPVATRCDLRTVICLLKPRGGTRARFKVIVQVI